MRQSRALWVGLFLLLLPLLTLSLRAEGTPGVRPALAEHLLVVYNENDPDSPGLAQYYAKAREIPSERVLGIKCPNTEAISREDFNKTVRAPIDAYLQKMGWLQRVPTKIIANGQEITVNQALKNEIWAMALIRGIPLKIEEDSSVPMPPGIAQPMQMNRASVDSELALLTFDSPPLYGPVQNPFYLAEGSHFFNSLFADSMIMVTRLDAPSPGDVRRMIDDSIRTEKLELTGRAYFDTRGLTDPASGYYTGDEWIKQTYELFRTNGIECSLDSKPEVYAENLPWNDVAFYAGWYEQDIKGPFLQQKFRFRPGAVAYHIHSFSASTLHSTTTAWAGPLIAKGAAATMGSVYEPYLSLTPNIASFYRGLLGGLTFAEAAYQSQAALSWMITMVGDPLYRPFPRDLVDNLKIAMQEDSPETPWLLMRTLRFVARQDTPEEAKVAEIQRIASNNPSSVIFEGLGDLWREMRLHEDEVGKAYETALKLAPNPESAIRIALKNAFYHEEIRDHSKVMADYENILALYPEQSAYYQVPQKALAYANTVGWTKFSPELQKYLSPVGTPTPATGGESTSTEAAPATNSPSQSRSDLIPNKPSLVPSKPNPSGPPTKNTGPGMHP